MRGKPHVQRCAGAPSNGRPYLSLTVCIACRRLLHPVHDLALQTFLNRDYASWQSWVRHHASASPRRKTKRRRPAEFLQLVAIPLYPAASCSDNLASIERMRVLGRACARFKCDACTCGPRGSGCLKKWVDAHRSRDPIVWTFRRKLRTNAFNIHSSTPLAPQVRGINGRSMVVWLRKASLIRSGKHSETRGNTSF